jgi:hypothetical protein
VYGATAVAVENGLSIDVIGEPKVVVAVLYEDLSINVLLVCRVNSTVDVVVEIAEILVLATCVISKGTRGGVNVPV